VQTWASCWLAGLVFSACVIPDHAVAVACTDRLAGLSRDPPGSACGPRSLWWCLPAAFVCRHPGVAPACWGAGAGDAHATSHRLCLRAQAWDWAGVRARGGCSRVEHQAVLTCARGRESRTLACLRVVRAGRLRGWRAHRTTPAGAPVTIVVHMPARLAVVQSVYTFVLLQATVQGMECDVRPSWLGSVKHAFPGACEPAHLVCICVFFAAFPRM
jgi:hypothetical protein